MAVAKLNIPVQVKWYTTDDTSMPVWETGRYHWGTGIIHSAAVINQVPLLVLSTAILVPTSNLNEYF